MSGSAKGTAKVEKRSPQRPIPHHTLEDALKVAQAIQKGNNGKPWKPVFIADYMKLKAGSQKFRDITSSAYKYAITKGTWNATTIALAPLGQSLTKPVKPEKEVLDRQKAVLSVKAFEKIYEYYRDGRLPSAEDTYFRNTLETDFKIPKKFLDDCINQLIANGKFAGILFESQGALHVTFEGPTVSSKVKTQVPPESIEEAVTEQIPKATAEPSKKNQIFVAHGKNRIPVKQLKTILDKFRVPYKVAIDEPLGGRPISKKVADLMHECTSAIIIFTADEMCLDAKGKEIWRPSDNAVYELGAASILYDKIVILKEDRVTLASDFSDIGYIPFEKDKLDAKAMDLITEFVGFGFVKITPT